VVRSRDAATRDRDREQLADATDVDDRIEETIVSRADLPPMGAPCPRCGSVMSHPLAAWLDRGVRASVQPGSARPVRALDVSPA